LRNNFATIQERTSSAVTGVAFVANRPCVLVVEPDRGWRRALATMANGRAGVESVESFAAARARLEDTRFDLVVANLRLGPYNGIHLAYLARMTNRATSVVVYSDELDAYTAREIQSAGALYERTERLLFALLAYVGGRLPPADRRDPTGGDRRRIVRGGRRAWDVRI
jgi:hypothetical protein